MSLFDIIKKLIRWKQPKLETSDIVSYDTSFIYIPKYSELSKEEKKVVDTYVAQIDVTKIENIIFYGESLYEQANINTELLLSLFYRMTDEQEKWKKGNISTEEGIQKRLEAMIAGEELELYKRNLKNLEIESTLRTVALEEILKMSKKRTIKMGIFQVAEKIARKNQEQQLDAAIERMKISKKMIEQQRQGIEKTSCDNTVISEVSDLISELSQDEGEGRRRALEAKKQELLEMAKLVIPEEAKIDNANNDEKTIINQLARIQRQLEIYAYTHKSEIEELRIQLEKINQIPKREQNKEALLKEIREIQIKYKVFGRYIQDEDLKQLYKAKFDVLTSDINKQSNSPFAELEDEKQLKYYKSIVQEKIGMLMQGTNTNLTRYFKQKKLAEAVRTIKEILKKGKSTFDIEQILKDRELLSLIVAFDREDGFENLCIDIKKVRDANIALYDYQFEWENQIPLKTIWTLAKTNGSRVTDELEPYLLLCYISNINENHKEEVINDIGIIKLPEGIVKIKYCSGNRYYRWPFMFFCINTSRLNRYHIVFPSTLKSIGENAFIDENRVKSVEFNEGLEEIEYGAFKRCSYLEGSIKTPSTLRKIGDSAFKSCRGISEIEFNEGLEKIGSYSFANCHGLIGRIRMPSTLREIGDWAFRCFCVIEEEDLLRIQKNRYYIINDCIEKIGENAFGSVFYSIHGVKMSENYYGNTKLPPITIPSTCKTEGKIADVGRPVIIKERGLGDR